MWRKPPKSGSSSKDVKKVEELKKAYEFLAWLDPFISLRSTKSNTEEKEKHVSQLREDAEESDDSDEDDGLNEDGDGDDDVEDDEVPKSPSIVTKSGKGVKRNIIKDQSPQETNFGSKNKRKRTRDMTPVERKELDLLDTLQDSIMNRNKEKGESKHLTTDELFGKIIGEDLKALPPISKLQARNDIQKIIFKYRMGSMQDSLQRKLNSTSSIDGFSPSKNAGQFAFQNNFRNGYQSFSPNASSSSSSNSGNHWIHGMNANTYEFA